MILFHKKCPLCKGKLSINHKLKYEKRREVICPKCNTSIPIITDDFFREILQEFYENKKSIIPSFHIMYFGTQEWVDISVNTHYFCPYKCKYCYAYGLIKKRGKRWKISEESLEKEEFILRYNWKKAINPLKLPFVVMYPSMHDLIYEGMNEHLWYIKNRLIPLKDATILLVSKGDFRVIKEMSSELAEYKSKIIWRLTITTNDQKELSDFFESNAPPYNERIKSLKYLEEKGFRTSISIEPLLPPKNKEMPFGEIEFVNSLSKITNGDIWIGLMNHIPKKRYNGRDITELESKHFSRIENFYDIEWIEKMVHTYYKNKQIYWKDSIKKIMLQYITQIARTEKWKT